MINQVDQVHFQHNKVDMVAGMRKMMAKKNDRTSLKVMYTLLEKCMLPWVGTSRIVIVVENIYLECKNVSKLELFTQ